MAVNFESKSYQASILARRSGMGIPRMHFQLFKHGDLKEIYELNMENQVLVYF